MVDLDRHTYPTMHKTENYWEPATWRRGSSAQCSVMTYRAGWRGQVMGEDQRVRRDICTHTTDSLHYTAKTHTALCN